MDTSKQFIPIPRFPSNIPSDEIMYVVVTNEEDQTVRGGVLSGGEIAGLVIGLVVALLLTIAIIVLLFCLHKRKQQKREKILELGQKLVTSVDLKFVNAKSKIFFFKGVMQIVLIIQMLKLTKMAILLVKRNHCQIISTTKMAT